MRPLLAYKERAISLRKQGYTYREILREIPVAKSTLSLWLREVGLAKKIQWVLTEKARLSALRGGRARYEARIIRSKYVIETAKKEVGDISLRELWLISVALYWAEGTKQKAHDPSRGVEFTNSDPRMIQFFLLWLRKILKIPEHRLSFEIYLHETARRRTKDVISYWRAYVDCTTATAPFKMYYKRSPIRTNRRNTGKDYKGILRIRIKNSTELNRSIRGWVEGIVKNSGIV